MNLDKIEKLARKWIKWSGEKQLKLFMKNKKTSSIFKDIINWSCIK